MWTELPANTVNESEQKSIPDQETMPELSKGDENDEWVAKMDIANAKLKTPLHTVRTIFTNQVERDIDDPNLMSEEIRQVHVKGPSVSTTAE